MDLLLGRWVGLNGFFQCHGDREFFDEIVEVYIMFLGMVEEFLFLVAFDIRCDLYVIHRFSLCFLSIFLDNGLVRVLLLAVWFFPLLLVHMDWEDIIIVSLLIA